MITAQPVTQDGQLTERLAHSGFRFTPQRQQVYAVLLDLRDHPTAEAVFIRVKQRLPDISMATVYNCLDALVRSGVVRLVQASRGAARYCPNMEAHWHFYCDRCEGVFDIGADSLAAQAFPLPPGFQAHHYALAIHGVCPGCAGPK